MLGYLITRPNKTVDSRSHSIGMKEVTTFENR